LPHGVAGDRRVVRGSRVVQHRPIDGAAASLAVGGGVIKLGLTSIGTRYHGIRGYESTIYL
jgi:hypothetical protein